jgi:hypothetical protein
MYLVTEPLNLVPCCRLPIELSVCPTCHGGIKPQRSFQWIDPRPIFDGQAQAFGCRLYCPMSTLPERAGLLWIGGSFYPSPMDWIKEAATQGVSRRIAQLPKELIVGTTRVFVAHRKAIAGERPGIFHSFVPRRIEYVVRGDETEEMLDKKEKRGITLVRVVTTTDQPDLFKEA